jgi:hypothetical protein
VILLLSKGDGYRQSTCARRFAGDCAKVLSRHESRNPDKVSPVPRADLCGTCKSITNRLDELG